MFYSILQQQHLVTEYGGHEKRKLHHIIVEHAFESVHRQNLKLVSHQTILRSTGRIYIKNNITYSIPNLALFSSESTCDPPLR